MTYAKYVAGLLLVLLILVLVISLRNQGNNRNAPSSSQRKLAHIIQYLPLGDSYTIGESVNEADRWPNQLVARLKDSGKTLHIVANPSVTGYTTQDLIDTELPVLHKLKPDFVTILIGVNDYVQGVNASTFRHNLEYIVSNVQNTLTDKRNVVLVTIPDYAKTPTGAQFGNPVQATSNIMAFNTIIKDVGRAHAIPVADIFTISQAVQTDSSLITSDGLHPSGKQYAEWTNIILQVLKATDLPVPSSSK